MSASGSSSGPRSISATRASSVDSWDSSLPSAPEDPGTGRSGRPSPSPRCARRSPHQGKTGPCTIYRDNEGPEVDFVAAGEGLRLVEAKWTGLPKPAEAAGLRRLATIGSGSGAPEFAAVRGYILCGTDRDFPLAAPESSAAKGGAEAKSPPIPVEAVGLAGIGRILGM